MKDEVNKGHEYAKNEACTEPTSFYVILHGDAFTPLEYVASVLERFFYFDRRKAVSIALSAHTQGKAICGSYSKDIAESKISQVEGHARRHQHPLICSLEAVCN